MIDNKGWCKWLITQRWQWFEYDHNSCWSRHPKSQNPKHISRVMQLWTWINFLRFFAARSPGLIIRLLVHQRMDEGNLRGCGEATLDATMLMLRHMAQHGITMLLTPSPFSLCFDRCWCWYPKTYIRKRRGLGIRSDPSSGWASSVASSCPSVPSGLAFTPKLLVDPPPDCTWEDGKVYTVEKIGVLSNTTYMAGPNVFLSPSLSCLKSTSMDANWVSRMSNRKTTRLKRSRNDPSFTLHMKTWRQKTSLKHHYKPTIAIHH